MPTLFNQQGANHSGWKTYPLQAGNKHLPGSNRAFYYERLLQDSSRLFEPDKNNFELLRLVFDDHSR